MTDWKRWGVSALLAVAIWVVAANGAQAQKLEIVFKDGLWGGAIGALLGVAQILLLDDPEGEEIRIVWGAGLGIIAGVGIGFADAGGAFARYESKEHRLIVGLPAPQVVQTPYGRQTRLTLFEASF